ncbi:MAG: HAD family phosphatase [Lachnospiraceae bacterium]|nr:HAD family phosphatase [Lachnospiraceae bacterium]
MKQNRTKEAEKILKTAKAVIFDVDGTLLDSMYVWKNAGEKYLDSLDIEAEPDLGDRLFAMSLEGAADYIRENYHLNKSREAIIAQVIQLVETEYFYNIPLKSGAERFLKLLKENNIPMAVATSSDRRVVEAAFKRLGIFDYFGRIFTCSETGAGKDKPDIYYRAAEYLGYPPEKIWVFEDALHAAQTAKNAGFHVTGIYDSSCAEQEKLKKLADIYIEEFSGNNGLL